MDAIKTAEQYAAAQDAWLKCEFDLASGRLTDAQVAETTHRQKEIDGELWRAPFTFDIGGKIVRVSSSRS